MTKKDDKNVLTSELNIHSRKQEISQERCTLRVKNNNTLYEKRETYSRNQDGLEGGLRI